jgi:hypothetical protein
MHVHNIVSRAWEQLTALTDRSQDELRTYGVQIPFNGSASPVERRLVAHRNGLIIRLDGNEILASVVNESVPSGKLPKPRRFVIEGDESNPLLVEQGGSPREVKQVFEDLVAWLRDSLLSKT